MDHAREFAAAMAAQDAAKPLPSVPTFIGPAMCPCGCGCVAGIRIAIGDTNALIDNPVLAQAIVAALQTNIARIWGK